ncbi:MAG: T9SS type A sorting domain-containing protein [Cyclobacteriaceae bacterium]
MNKLLPIVFLIFTVNSAIAQYTGGNNDGYGDGTLIQTTCPDLTPNFIYFGGNDDGYSDGTLTQSTCTDLTPNFIYYGGNNDGYSDGTLTQSTCTDLTPNFIYYGGNNDGYSDGTLTQSTCTDLTPNFIYYGGNNDGYSDRTLTQSTCTDLTPNFIYYGGNNDGYSDGTLTQSTCTDLTPNFIYYGGISDGFGWHFIQPIICTTRLPIELLEFKAKLGKEGVEISWVTATEINNDFFTVEKSNNGIDFYSLTKIAGAGNSTQQIKYSVTDISPFQGVNYYRLKQTDYDGKFDYSRVIYIDVESSLPTNSIYPNPNDGKSFYVKLPNSGYRNIQIKIQGLDGKTILSETVYESGTFEFIPSVKLASGVYVISIFDNGNFSNIKLVVK